MSAVRLFACTTTRARAAVACGAVLAVALFGLAACPAAAPGPETRELPMIEAGPGDGPGTRARIVVLEHGAGALSDEDALTDRVRTARPDVLIVERAPSGSRDHASLLVALAGAAELRHLAWMPSAGRTERWVAARWPVALTDTGFAVGRGGSRVEGDRMRDLLRWDCADDAGRAPAVENAARTLGVLVCPPWEVIRSGSGDDAGVLPSDMLRLELGRVAADPDDH